MRLTVPGNILLFGEYAVLEEAGLGIALAVERRVRVSAVTAAALVIAGSWGSGTASWTADRPGDSPLLSATVESVRQWLAVRGARVLPNARIDVDSSAFFKAEGGKSGFGGSAAVSVGVTCGLLACAGMSAAARGAEAERLALAAHRLSQGGRGSGYDVLCSFHGGMGLFHGGKKPTWEPCRLPWEPVFFLFPGPAPVSTPQAIGRYEQWKGRNPGAAADFLRESNAKVGALRAARTDGEAAAALIACRDLAVTLGAAMGVEARIPAPSGCDPDWCKAVGAGNELGVLVVPRGSTLPEAPGLERVSPSEKGVMWEENGPSLEDRGSAWER